LPQHNFTYDRKHAEAKSKLHSTIVIIINAVIIMIIINAVIITSPS